MKTNPNEHAFVQNGNLKGLTKREHMAIEFTKALVSYSGTINAHDIPSTVERGIKIADELIKQLNDEK